jgi:hypothetical protein
MPLLRNAARTLLFAVAMGGAPYAKADLVTLYTFDNSGNLGENTGSATAVAWNSFSGVTQGTGLFGGGSGSFTAGTSSAWTSGFSAAGTDFNQFSLSLHVKTTTTANWDDFISIGATAGQFFLEKNSSNGVSLFNSGPGGDTPANSGSTGITINDGQWHHLGITVGSNTLSFYADGALVSSTAYTGSGTIAGYQLASRLGDSARAITAELDDVAIYSTTLTSDQMNWLSSNAAIAVPVPEPGLAVLALVGIAGGLISRRIHRR